MTRKTRTEEEYRELYQYLMTLVWIQPRHEILMDRHMLTSMLDMTEMELVKSDASNGSIKLKAKHSPLKGERAALKDK